MKEKNLLLIFTRNPELGKCKTRLAASIGDENALAIYKQLLKHTVSITKDIEGSKEVHYSVKVRVDDYWDPSIYRKKQQAGNDLGERMEFAFANGFKNGFKNIIIIGSDMYDLNRTDIEAAFKSLELHDYVIGPAVDGGYYLLGMKSLHSEIFKSKKWGSDTVLKDTLKNIEFENYKLLEERNDIDLVEDIRDIEIFQHYITQ